MKTLKTILVLSLAVSAILFSGCGNRSGSLSEEAQIEFLNGNYDGLKADESYKTYVTATFVVRKEDAKLQLKKSKITVELYTFGEVNPIKTYAFELKDAAIGKQGENLYIVNAKESSNPSLRLVADVLVHGEMFSIPSLTLATVEIEALNGKTTYKEVAKITAKAPAK